MSHISYSALKIFNECPYKFKLLYEDKVPKSNGSEYTSFGTALHEAAEMKVQDESVDEVKIFLDKFESEIVLLKEQKPSLDEKLLNEMREQGKKLAPQIIPALKEHFGEFKLMAAEEDILEAIKEAPELNYDFKGFIDLIIKTPDDKIHILDWKSCAWGWDQKKKSDPIVTYQLTFYKHFYAQKHGFDPKNIETYFALLKRTAKKNNVEIFRVTSGSKKTQNAFNMLKKALYNIDKSNFPKNRMSCAYCEFKKTEHCP
jgi:PD-(D/E)XK nuclease superfamily